MSCETRGGGEGGAGGGRGTNTDDPDTVAGAVFAGRGGAIAATSEVSSRWVPESPPLLSHGVVLGHGIDVHAASSITESPGASFCARTLSLFC